VYLVTGTWNKLDDVNTLVDVGMDEQIINKINNASTGVGKHKAEQIVLTHSHFDHVGMLQKVKAEFHSKTLAFSNSLEGVDHVLIDGDILKMGDRDFEVIHMPGHSTDSICLYNEEDRVLFAGDSPIIIKTGGGRYIDKFVEVMTRLSQLPIDIIYFGHGNPLKENCNELIKQSIKNVTS
jgi:glyoxylase-like metal-dependent hydrolase (beta-lactamase superfamily II)